MSAFEPENPEVTSVIDPDGINCVLAAGDITDLVEIREWLSELPESSYGQVFFEVSSQSQIEPLHVPERVSVTWLCRESLETSEPTDGAEADAFVSGSVRLRGAALAAAVDAWCSEWLWSDSNTGRDFHLWMGARTSVAMLGYWAKFDRKLVKRCPGYCETVCKRDCL